MYLNAGHVGIGVKDPSKKSLVLSREKQYICACVKFSEGCSHELVLLKYCAP